MTSSAASDVELLARWREGDRSAGEALVLRHYDSIERFFLNKIAVERVPDLVQETFTLCVAARNNIDDGARLRAYLLTIAHRVFCAHLRDKYRVGDPVELERVSIATLSASPSSAYARTQEQRLLLEGLRSIALNYQIVLELHYWEQLTTGEIAVVLEIPAATARTRLRRARDALSAAMASLARSPALLDSTQTRLNDWVQRCRREFADASARARA